MGAYSTLTPTAWRISPLFGESHHVGSIEGTGRGRAGVKCYSCPPDLREVKLEPKFAAGNFKKKTQTHFPQPRVTYTVVQKIDNNKNSCLNVINI